jgi:ribosomal protein S18 acetylase RimI-like enzyme
MLPTDEYSDIHPRKKRATSNTRSVSPLHTHQISHTDLVRNTNALSVLEFQSRFLPRDPHLLTFIASSSATPDGTAKNIVISFKFSSELAKSDLGGCFSLIKETSSEAYKNSVVRWRPKAKKEEMRDPDMRYLIVRLPDSLAESSTPNQSDLPVSGFLSFMITYDDDHEFAVLYVYEIHLSERLRGCGVGAHLMHLAEIIAQRIGLTKVMLTVFSSNSAAHNFYRKLGFSKDKSSPESRVLRNGIHKPVDYMILSKDVLKSTSSPLEIAST